MNTIAFDYFPDGIMKDICEEYNACNVDQKSFKAYLSKWMASATQMAPFTYNQSLALLRSSAKAAAEQCDGPPNGTTCGLKWYMNSTWDGTSGVGQQMAAMEVILSTLVGWQTPQQAPLTVTTGGTSVSNPNAGFNGSAIPPAEIIIPPTKTMKAGAWVLTAVVSLLAICTVWFMCSSVWEPQEPASSPTSTDKGKTVSAEK